MLKAQKEREEHGHLIIETKEWCCSPLSLQERNVWREQEGIVVSTDESIFRGERMDDAATSVGERAARCGAGTNLIRMIIFDIS